MIVKSILFYATKSGKCPVKSHLDTLSDSQVTKITWVLKLIRELDQVPSKYFKKLANTDDIWEVRVSMLARTHFAYSVSFIVENV